MIKKLRKRFIRIAMLSVSAVMLLLSLIVNAANFISINSDLTKMLDMICENQGKIPSFPGEGNKAEQHKDDRPIVKPDDSAENTRGPFNKETPYSTRYFYLRYDGSGTLYSADMEHIAAISSDDAGEYLSVALKHGEGYGYCSGYKYRIVKQGEDRYMAVFLDCSRELRTVRIFGVCSFFAIAACIALVYIPVVFFSGKAIAPVVQSVRRQKQFITDAGHELKTPITVIATSLSVLEMETGKQKWIDKAKAQTERMRDLVNSMVTLSRMDEDSSPLKFEPFPISEAISETAGSFYDFAVSKGHDLQIKVEPNITYCGDEYAVRQLVSILLDNAVKYAVADSPIAFSMEKTKRGILIRTSNQCEKIEQDNLEKLFDRFYRTDSSRNTATGGFGIGLSIAQSIALGHKGSIKACCPVKNEIEFTVELR